MRLGNRTYRLGYLVRVKKNRKLNNPVESKVSLKRIIQHTCRNDLRSTTNTVRSREAEFPHTDQYCQITSIIYQKSPNQIIPNSLTFITKECYNVRDFSIDS